MGCNCSVHEKDLPEKLNWTRPDFDELSWKGEEALKKLNRVKRSLFTAWDTLETELSVRNMLPETLYLAMLVCLSMLSDHDFSRLEVNILSYPPGLSFTVTSLDYSLAHIYDMWTNFCNQLVDALPLLYSLKEDILYTANVYYKLTEERVKLAEEQAWRIADFRKVEPSIQENLKVLLEGGDQYHHFMNCVSEWLKGLWKVVGLCKDPNFLGKVHSIAAETKAAGTWQIHKLVQKEKNRLESLVRGHT